MTHLSATTRAANQHDTNTGLARSTRKPQKASLRRIVAWAGAGALTASLGVGALGLGDAGAEAAAPARGGERSRSATEFVSVHHIGPISREGTPLAMTAPARGTVFVLMKNRRGQAEVHRITTPARGNAKPSVHRYALHTPLAEATNVTIDGTAANDVWVTANGAAWHFGGRGFTRVALPSGASAVTVADAPGPKAYLGTRSAKGGAVWLYTSGAKGASWTSLGHASRENFPDWGLPILDLRFVDGRLFGMWAQQYSALLNRAVYEHGSGTWTQRYLASSQHPSGGVSQYTWLTPKAGSHVLLGLNQRPSSLPWLTTSTWSGGAVESCSPGTPSASASEKAAVLNDGRLITAGLRIRSSACGTERPLRSAPLDETLAITAERGSNTAWALTRKGNVISLQRFVG